jgi:hypothetical protein
LHLSDCHNPAVRRFGAILLVLASAAIGSGLLLHVHNLAHAAEHVDVHGEHHPVPADSRTCDLHGKLTAPVIATGFTPVLIALGLFIAFLTQLSPAWVCAFAHRRLDCRGPPVC